MWPFPTVLITEVKLAHEAISGYHECYLKGSRGLTWLVFHLVWEPWVKGVGNKCYRSKYKGGGSG